MGGFGIQRWLVSVVVRAGVVESSLHQRGVVVAALFPVQLQRLLPHLAGLVVLPERGVGWPRPGTRCRRCGTG
ncbi:hypothetical protein ACWEIJ_13175 [Lentzea sp. NPDC004789]